MVCDERTRLELAENFRGFHTEGRLRFYEREIWAFDVFPD
jgi:hypothetical protein